MSKLKIKAQLYREDLKSARGTEIDKILLRAAADFEVSVKEFETLEEIALDRKEKESEI